MPEVQRRRIAAPLASPRWQGRVAVVSPHLDDAVLSLGATMRAATRLGARIDVLTVLSGDPASTTPSDANNLRAGFATAGDAARARRLEDERACRMVGARALWLPFADDANEPIPDDDAIVESLSEHLRDYDSVVLPGFPLRHRDHQRIARLTLRALEPGTVIGLYVEQPYASWRAFSRKALNPRASVPTMSLRDVGLDVPTGGRWHATRARPSDWRAKASAAGLYKSQIAVLRRAPRARILAYELLRGGERVMWCKVH